MIHSGSVIGQYKGHTVISCNECGLWHLDPIPLKAMELYERTFYSELKPHYLEDTLKYKEWWDKMAMIEMTSWASVRSDPAKRLLDVGSGFGLFADCVSQFGYEVTELEPAEQPRALRSKNHPVMSVPIESANLPTEHYSVIRMAWVLEHVSDPDVVIRKCRDALLPSGLLSITVPNEFTPLQWIVRETYGDYWISPMHCFYFDLVRLNCLLSRCGFEIVNTSTSFPMELFLLMGHNYVKNPEVGDMVHSWRVSMELNLMKSEAGISYFLQQRRNWAQEGIGRDLLVVAVKR